MMEGEDRLSVGNCGSAPCGANTSVSIALSSTFSLPLFSHLSFSLCEDIERLQSLPHTLTHLFRPLSVSLVSFYKSKHPSDPGG